MNAARLLPSRAPHRAAAGRRALVATPGAWAGVDLPPPCLRSEAFAEDLADQAPARAVPLATLPAPRRGTARSAPLAVAAAVGLAALLGALVLGLGLGG
jgi:hypothetical protein